MKRCDHGNYIPQGDRTAPNCSGCGTAHMGIVVGQRRSLGVIVPVNVRDACEYNEAPIDERLQAAAEMENMTA